MHFKKKAFLGEKSNFIQWSTTFLRSQLADSGELILLEITVMDLLS